MNRHNGIEKGARHFNFILKIFFAQAVPLHTESDENGLAIQKKFQVCEHSFQPIQCFLCILFNIFAQTFIYQCYKWFLQEGVFGPFYY